MEEWEKNTEKFRKGTREAQQALLDGIRTKVSTAKLHGPEPGSERSPAHLGISFAGLEAESLALVLDRMGVAARGGSGCVTREMKIPPAMQVIGAKPEEARALILFTLGVGNKTSEMVVAAERVAEAVKKLKAAMPG